MQKLNICLVTVDLCKMSLAAWRSPWRIAVVCSSRRRQGARALHRGGKARTSFGSREEFKVEIPAEGHLRASRDRRGGRGTAAALCEDLHVLELKTSSLKVLNSIIIIIECFGHYLIPFFILFISCLLSLSPCAA